MLSKETQEAVRRVVPRVLGEVIEVTRMAAAHGWHVTHRGMFTYKDSVHAEDVDLTGRDVMERACRESAGEVTTASVAVPHARHGLSIETRLAVERLLLRLDSRIVATVEVKHVTREDGRFAITVRRSGLPTSQIMVPEPRDGDSESRYVLLRATAECLLDEPQNTVLGVMGIDAAVNVMSCVTAALWAKRAEEEKRRHMAGLVVPLHMDHVSESVVVSEAEVQAHAVRRYEEIQRGGRAYFHERQPDWKAARAEEHSARVRAGVKAREQERAEADARRIGWDPEGDW
jgi:hypothetical protein